MIEISPVLLEGRHVRLEPLVPDHLDALAAIGLDPELWRIALVEVHDREAMRRYIDAAFRQQREGTGIPFVTVERKGDTIVGSTRFLNIDAPHRRAEIGSTWLAAPWRRTAINTEAKYLMLCHAFETWGLRRVEFKTDVVNAQSRAAVLRLGAKEEGIFRKHMITESGRRRDSVFFSIIDDEWPAVKAGLEQRMAVRR
ncbi:MAG: GNAT family N-acetyltransferase [Gemmatimonadales bacterium]